MTTTVTLVSGPAQTTSITLVGGEPGQGVPTGGTTGQVLVKSSDTAFDTEWIDRDVFDSIQFDTAAGVSVATGQLAWNAVEGTLDLGMNGTGFPVLQIGQEMYYRVHNATGSAIPDGTVVMANGTDGNSGTINVAPAVADGSVDPRYFMGVATETIANGALGYVTNFGKVRGLDTSAWTNGTVLYADPATSGGLTDVEPQAPNANVQIAVVINSHAQVGTIQVRPTVTRQDVAHRVSVPATATSSGAVGDYATDASYAYFCVAQDTWRRVAISSW